ncbi:hypothetical protein [Desulfonatronum parangueonense]
MLKIRGMKSVRFQQLLQRVREKLVRIPALAGMAELAKDMVSYDTEFRRHSDVIPVKAGIQYSRVTTQVCAEYLPLPFHFPFQKVIFPGTTRMIVNLFY